MGPRDIIPYRVGVFAFVTLLSITAYTGFDFFYEVIRHVPGPSFHAVHFVIIIELVRERAHISKWSQLGDNIKLEQDPLSTRLDKNHPTPPMIKFLNIYIT
jgi:hypothetical protein